MGGIKRGGGGGENNSAWVQTIFNKFNEFLNTLKASERSEPKSSLAAAS